MADGPFLIVSPDYPPPFVGGSLVQIHNLVTHFPAACEVLTAGRPSQADSTPSPCLVTRRPWLVPSSPDPPRLKLVVMYLYLVGFALTRSRRHRAIVAHTGIVGNSLLFLIGRLTGTLVVGFEYAEALTLALRGRGLKNSLKRWLAAAAYPRAGGLITLSAYSRDLFTRFGVSSDRIAIAFPSLAPGKRQSGGRERQGQRSILSCGRLVRRKGFDLLIDAMVQISPAMPDVRLDIVGDGPLRAALVRQVSDRGLDQVVRFHGRASDEDLSSLYASCEVFVLANIALENGDAEDAPSTAIEASAYGKPVIIGASGGTASTVEHGVTGYRIDPSNPAELSAALQDVLSDTARARAMGDAGRRKIADDHDPQKIAAGIHRFIVGLLESRAAPRTRQSSSLG